MCHRMEAKFAKCDMLHLAIRRMELDPILVTAKSIARMEDGRMRVGNLGNLVQPPPRHPAKSIEVRFHCSAEARIHVQIEQIAEPAIDSIEVEPATIRRDQRGSAAI